MGQTKRVRCAGCGNRMYQLAKQNRDLQGKSWHYNCVANYVSHQEGRQ
jgi:hypothetical protein